jgi:hypothetical protein
VSVGYGTRKSPTQRGEMHHFHKTVYRAISATIPLSYCAGILPLHGLGTDDDIST